MTGRPQLGRRRSGRRGGAAPPHIRALIMAAWMALGPAALRAGFDPVATISIHAQRLGAGYDNLVKLNNIVVDETRRVAYFAGDFTEAFGVVDLDAMTLARTFNPQVSTHMAKKVLMVNRTTGELYVLVAEDGTLCRVNPTSGTLVRSVSVPHAAGVDSVSGRVFADTATDTITAYDADLQPVGTIGGLTRIRTLTVHEGRLYVAQVPSSLTVSVYDCSSLEKVAEFALPSAISDRQAHLAADGERAYITSTSGLAILDLASGTCTVVATADNPGEVVASGGRVYVMTGFPFERGYMPTADGAYGIVEVRDSASGGLLSRMRTDFDTFSFDLDPAGGRLVYSSTGRGGVGFVDLASGRLLKLVYAGTELETLACRSSDGAFYVRDRLGGGFIHVIDPVTRLLETSLTGPSWPTDMAVDNGRGHLYVLGHYEALIAVYDTQTDRLAYEIPLGVTPARTDGISVMACDTNSGMLYAAFPEWEQLVGVAESGSGTAAVVRIQDFEFSGGPGQLHLAVNPSAGRVFLLLRDAELLNVYDGSTLELLRQVSVQGASLYEGVSLMLADAAANRLYVGPYVADGTTGSLLGTIPEGERVVGVDPRDGEVFIAAAPDLTSGYQRVVSYGRGLTAREGVWNVRVSEGIAAMLGFDFPRGRMTASYAEQGEVDLFDIGMTPGGETPLAPGGRVEESYPVFTWSGGENAMWHEITIWREGSYWWSGWAQGGSWTPTWDFQSYPGNYEWWVRGWNEKGYGEWSGSQTFQVGVPGAPTPSTPSGWIADAYPAFSWEAAAGSAWHLISIWRDGQYWWSRWVQGESWVPTWDFQEYPGSYQWWVQAWNSEGYGPWSEGLTFQVVVPETPTPVAPSGRVAEAYPRFSWSGEGGSTWHQIVIWREGEYWWSEWVQTDSWTPSWDVQQYPGNYEWWVRGWNSQGYGEWSSGQAFQIGVPGAPQPIAPSGPVEGGQPSFSWSGGEGATWHQIWVRREGVDWWSEWVGTPSWTPSWDVGEHPGNYEWWVQGWNEQGVGPWSAPAEFAASPQAPAD